jgi:thioredoxin 1
LSTIRVSDDYKGKAKVASVDIDDERELMSRFNISNVPCLNVFQSGSRVSEHNGYAGMDKMTGMLDQALA